MALSEFIVASGAQLEVQRFRVREALSELFAIELMVTCADPQLDLEQIVGNAASFRLASGGEASLARALLPIERLWTGVVSSIEQVHALGSRAASNEVSSYRVQFAPAVWLLSHRRNNRIFQHLSIPAIVTQILGEWSVPHVWELAREQYPELEFKVQYGESDFQFISRLLEDAGVAFSFAEHEGQTRLVLSDTLEQRSPRAAGALTYVENANAAPELAVAGGGAFQHVTKVKLSHAVRPGTVTVRDYDFRKPVYPLYGRASEAVPPEASYEQFSYEPAVALREGAAPHDTPVADDRGVARHEQRWIDHAAQQRLESLRMDRRSVNFATNAIDLAPGTVFRIDGHPHHEIAEGGALLVTEFGLEGDVDDEWSMVGQAMFTSASFRPLSKTPLPRVLGVQSAVVVGPAGEEIHTDEFGRVRVQFPWDREGRHDERSSCWVRVSQGWAGTGYGMIVLPRIGHEVLVAFLGGNPDAPMIVGRTFNALQTVPYKLPEHKTRSTWKSDSSKGSNGFNELMFEDLKGKELVYVQAEKNLRKLVKNDETITVGNDRQKLVLGDETETTAGDRIEVTHGSRVEITDKTRTVVIGGELRKLVSANEIERTLGNVTRFTGQDEDVVIGQSRREHVVGNSHLDILGERRERVTGDQSLSVGKSRHEVVGKSYALEAVDDMHVKAGSALVIEAAEDLTIKGPGGFIRIDGSGITIRGTLVRINSGGEAGEGSGANPQTPDAAVEAAVEEPVRPTPDNVAETGLAQ